MVCLQLVLAQPMHLVFLLASSLSSIMLKYDCREIGTDQHGGVFGREKMLPRTQQTLALFAKNFTMSSYGNCKKQDTAYLR